MFPNTYFPITYFCVGYFTILASIILSMGGGGTSQYWKERAKEKREQRRKEGREDREKDREEEAMIKLALLDEEAVLKIITDMFKMGFFDG